ncbi:helix-turn-helix transcriptional regulator [Streptomyces sp. NE06-03C]|uniref:helix-turn-helix transcriptional regulator n=1 Tax=Streptomyces sp. NE06-03C TaxID=3028694 RepID=UPI0029A4FDB2|nr:helix-turn-helix transcriptional regulator [Streptomyces sp. NE06-03C]MDX2921832.1 helix-turn-helix transcriptional regulator [Streptomyces sp. NE06-03C]
MPDHSDALTRLVQEHVGAGRALTIRDFAQAAVDPKSGTSISKSTAGNLVQGHSVKITPEVLGAIAAGLGVSLAQVQLAAMRQYVGVVVDDPFDADPGDDDTVVRVAHDPDLSAEDMPTVRAFVERPRPTE